jgi:formate hydrogenlyase subunit 3/multisubunit Na+/H+ antiporter MnhD subunit
MGEVDQRQGVQPMTPFDYGPALMIAAIGLPLLLVASLGLPLLRPLALASAPWANVPALLVAVSLPADVTCGFSWAILGTQLGSPSELTRGFMLLTACVWFSAGWYARTYVTSDPLRARFWSFFLASSGGNFGLILARDVASFYAFYALMTFAAYGLVVHTRTEAARRAGRVYIIMALLGEMLLLSAFLFIVGAQINIRVEEASRAIAAAGRPDILVALLCVGFGVKAGAFLLHLWLPLAHPVAPTPASAVLSGAMIKAGVLGWLSFLPLGLIALPALGWSCIVAGFAAAFYAAAVGVTQRDPKTILAYSSVSQMGFMTAALGVALAYREAAPAAAAGILLFSMHHALVKGALFLGVGVASATSSGWPARLVVLGLLGSALNLAGAPLSSGALAKTSLKNALGLVPLGAAPLSWLLSLAAVGSTLLMFQYLRRALPESSADRRSPSLGLWGPWGLLLVLQVVLIWRPALASEHLSILAGPAALWAASWPLAVGLAIAGVASVLGRRGARIPEVPAGDVLVLLELFSRNVQRAGVVARQAMSVALRHSAARVVPLTQLASGVIRSAERAEASLGAVTTIGLMFLILLVFLLARLLVFI